jgi:hypothetical protein
VRQRPTNPSAAAMESLETVAAVADRLLSRYARSKMAIRPHPGWSAIRANHISPFPQVVGTLDVERSVVVLHVSRSPRGLLPAWKWLACIERDATRQVQRASAWKQMDSTSD